MASAEVNKKSSEEEMGIILRIQELRKLESEWRLKLSKAERDFMAMIASHQKEWEQEYERHIEEMKNLPQ